MVTDMAHFGYPDKHVTQITLLTDEEASQRGIMSNPVTVHAHVSIDVAVYIVGTDIVRRVMVGDKVSYVVFAPDKAINDNEDEMLNMAQWIATQAQLHFMERVTG